MALRNNLRFSPASSSGGGALPGCTSIAELSDHRRARTAIWEIRETAAAVMFIGRFVIFVAALLAKHHLRRLSPAAPMRGAKAIATTLGPPVAASRRRAVVRCRG
jgi:hypothetical protein